MDGPLERERAGALFGLTPDAPHLDEALTHPSYANELGGVTDNQRLEFLGDAVLDLCVSELLMERFPDADEGYMTRLRAQLVSTEALAAWARTQDLASALQLGRGARAGGVAESDNTLADAVEALIAAAYLDVGLDAARAACAMVVAERLDAVDTGAPIDPKSDLQERVQAKIGVAPVYTVVDSGGPAHERWFRVAVEVEGRRLGEGEGRSKRVAERAAAEAALGAGAVDRLEPPTEVRAEGG